MKIDATLQRFDKTSHGTVGQLLVNGHRICYTMEPPDHDNKTGKSCIPEGVYRCRWQRSPRFGWTYLVENVPGRSSILIHSGNLGGDVDRGWMTHTRGCILPGLALGFIGKQRAVLASKLAVRHLNVTFEKMPFNLEITNGFSFAA